MDGWSWKKDSKIEKVEGRRLLEYVCVCVCVCMYVCVCVYVRHAQKIAKLFFERAKHAVPFQIKYIIH